jgi:hypothetical protein
VSDKDQKIDLDDELLSKSYERLKDIQPPESVDLRILSMAGQAVSQTGKKPQSVWSGWRYRLAAVATVFLAVSVTLRMLSDMAQDEMLMPGSVQSEHDYHPTQTTASDNLARTPVVNSVMELAEERREPQAISQLASSETPDDRGLAMRKVYRQSEGVAPDESAVDTGGAASFDLKDDAVRKAATKATQDGLLDMGVPDPTEKQLPDKLHNEPDNWLMAIDELIDDGQIEWARREIVLFRERWPGRELGEKYDIE